MIKSISYWSLKQGLDNTHPLADALAETKEAGFAGLELSVAPEGVITPTTDQATCEKYRSQIEESNLVVETMASGMSWGFNPTSEDPQVRKKSIELHAGALQRAAWLGCKALLFVPGVVKSPISTDLIRYDKAVQRGRQAVSQLLEVAEKVGVDLCVENVWNGLFYSPLELGDFVDSFKSERLGVYFDVGNVLGYHQHPPHWIELLDRRIKRVHIKDFKQSVGTLEGFCDLLEGDVPWEQSMAALRKIGYDKTIVAEMLPWKEGQLQRTSAAMDKILR